MTFDRSAYMKAKMQAKRNEARANIGEFARRSYESSFEEILNGSKKEFWFWENRLEAIEFKIKSGNYNIGEMDSVWRKLKEMAMKKPEMRKKASEIMYKLELAKERKSVDYSLRDLARDNRIKLYFNQGKLNNKDIDGLISNRNVDLECKLGILGRNIETSEKGELQIIMNYVRKNYKNCNSCYEGLMARRVNSKAKARYSNLINQESEESIEVKESLFSRMKSYFGRLLKPVEEWQAA
ncbi:MAG: hypothetical protein ABIH72_00460 [archaeon]